MMGMDEGDDDDEDDDDDGGAGGNDDDANGDDDDEDDDNCGWFLLTVFGPRGASPGASGTSRGARPCTIH